MASLAVASALLASTATALADEPRPFVVADLADRSAVGLSFTYGRSGNEDDADPWPNLTSTIYTVFADWSVRPGLKLWASLPIAQREGRVNPNLYRDEHTALGQLSLGVRQMWSAGEPASPWRPRWSAGASFAGTPRSSAGSEAGLTMAAALLVSGVHPSHFAVATTTMRVHGDAAVTRGPLIAQLGLSLLARSPDEREIRGELAFEAMVGVRVHSRVAILAESTGSFFDASVVCQSTCQDSYGGFTQVVSGNLGVRVALPYALVGARLILPLADGHERYPGRGAARPSLSVEASASF